VAFIVLLLEYYYRADGIQWIVKNFFEADMIGKGYCPHFQKVRNNEHGRQK
jgi:hypothetical protein